GGEGKAAVGAGTPSAVPKTPVQVGGGMRSRERIDAALAAGADRVVIGTAALEDPALLRDVAARHPGRVVLGLDAKGGKVATRGWREVSARTPREVLAELGELPLAAVLYTEIGRDGLLQGPDL